MIHNLWMKIIRSNHEIWRIKSWNLRCLRSVWYCCCCWYCFCRDACGVRPNALFGSGFKGNIERNRLLKTVCLLVLSRESRDTPKTVQNSETQIKPVLYQTIFVHQSLESRESQAMTKQESPFFQSSAIINSRSAIEFFDTNTNRFSNAVFPFLEHALKKHFSR